MCDPAWVPSSSPARWFLEGSTFPALSVRAPPPPPPPHLPSPCQYPPQPPLGPRVLFDSAFGAPLHVSVADVTVRARDGDRVIYRVPDACVARLSPSPLLRIQRDHASGDLTFGLYDGVPPGLRGAVAAAAATVSRVEVRGVPFKNTQYAQL
jgi:hypothetical protein